MKKIVLGILIGLLFIQNVYAKDSIFSIHHYEEENIYNIEKVMKEDGSLKGLIVSGEII